MEGAILSSQSNGRFRAHLKNAASALCARTLPKQRVRTAGGDAQAAAAARHHTYPCVSVPRRPALALRVHLPPPPQRPVPVTVLPEDTYCEINAEPTTPLPNGIQKLTGKMAREVASAWGGRVGAPSQPAPADRVQSLFNDLHLYPTKTQVFEMLVCARQCARRQSLTLTFGEFCVFAAELRKCSRRARQASNKAESPYWVPETPRTERELPKTLNGSEASPPPAQKCEPEVFLGGSCNPTTWRSDIAIPMLDQMGISYFNPQVDDWSTELVEVEHRAKAAARALLFVLDCETRAVAAAVEAAQLAATPRDLLLVLRPYKRHQRIGNENITDLEYVELSRARATLQEAVERRGLPAFTDIPAALRCARAVLRGARTNPRQHLGQTILRLKRAFDSAGGRSARLARSRALAALTEVARASPELAEKILPQVDSIDFETFCAAVAELATSSEQAQEQRTLNGHMEASPAEARCAPSSMPEGEHPSARCDHVERPRNGLDSSYNARLKACGKKLGILIPKAGSGAVTGGGGVSSACSSATDAGSGGDTGSAGAVLTPGTERRLERLPDMLRSYTHDVYLGGSFPSNARRPEEVLKAEGFTYIVPRVNDYTRMFSAPARRAAPAHPESPRTDKKPRPDRTSTGDDDVELRDRSGQIESNDRLSASDFYNVTEDVTPQPFKGTYEEEPLWKSRVLVFALNAESACFAAMVLAAHYMSLRPANTVLLVQPMNPVLAIPYSEAAIKDYNRGRHYLTDLARRCGVPVFDSPDDVLDCVLAKLKDTHE